MVLVVVPAVLAAPMFILAMCAPVSVRREYARWSHVSLWAVARDGFLGRI